MTTTTTTTTTEFAESTVASYQSAARLYAIESASLVTHLAGDEEDQAQFAGLLNDLIQIEEEVVPADRDAARAVVREAVGYAAWDAARSAYLDAAEDAAWNAARAASEHANRIRV